MASVSRTRCSVLTLLRRYGTGPISVARNGPGSAKRYCVSHRVRGKCSGDYASSSSSDIPTAHSANA